VANASASPCSSFRGYASAFAAFLSPIIQKQVPQGTQSMEFYFFPTPPVLFNALKKFSF